MKRKIKHIRLIISSFIGGVYAIVIYLKISHIASTIFMKIILSIVMVWIAFKDIDYKKLMKDLLMFYLISFVFGGCSFALIYFINPEKVKINNGVLVGLYPIKVTLIAGVVAFIVIQIAFKITKNKISSSDMIGTLQIYYKNQSTKVKALIDSGNMLKEPISGYPVAVVEKQKVEKILPEELLDIVNKMEGGVFEGALSEYMSKVRLIPFSSLGKENGMLVGIKADKVKIIFKETEKFVDNVIVGIYNKKITKENSYNALIGLNLLEECEQNEYIADAKGKC